MEAQPFIGNGLFKIGKSSNGHLMAPALQLASQNNVGAHIAGGANADHGNTHLVDRLALVKIGSA